MRERIPAGTVFALVFVATIACSDSTHETDEDSDNFREDVITCEDAVARLERCCPGFDPTPVLCNYYYLHTRDVGCGTTMTNDESTSPALAVEEAKCIQQMDCALLSSSGVCSRAAAARELQKTSSATTPDDSSDEEQTASSTSFVSPTHAEVCP